MIAFSGSCRSWSCSQRGLAGAGKPEKQEPDVGELSVGAPDVQDLRAGVQAEAALALDPVHRLAQHRLLRLAGVVGAEDVRVALVDVAEDERLGPVGNVDRDEVGLLRGVGREEHVVPHVRDPRVILRHEEPAVDRDLRAHPHAPVHLDQVHLRQRFLDLPDLLHGAGGLDGLLHHADRDVRDDVGLPGGPVLDPGGIDRGAVLGRFLSGAGEGAERFAREIPGDRSSANRPGRDRIDCAHGTKSFYDSGFGLQRGAIFIPDSGVFAAATGRSRLRWASGPR
jgi:hypothetical protein